MEIHKNSFALAIFAVTLVAASQTVKGDPKHPVLHPSGFGMHSYAAWKAQQGLEDSSGAKNQALYFQKDTLTANFAAGVATIDGFEGTSTRDLGELAFWYRKDGHCGAGAPRFNVRVDVGPGVPRQTIFFGCNSGMVPAGERTDSQNRVWERRTTGNLLTLLPAGTITSLAIVYDEGEEFPPGFVYLDDIQVGNKIWTSAADNAND
jgi:hypothetical protein